MSEDKDGRKHSVDFDSKQLEDVEFVSIAFRRILRDLHGEGFLSLRPTKCNGERYMGKDGETERVAFSFTFEKEKEDE